MVKQFPTGLEIKTFRIGASRRVQKREVRLGCVKLRLGLPAVLGGLD